MKFIVSTIVAATALIASAAHADGLYVGGSVGGSRYHGDDIGGLAIDHSSTAYKLYGGYSFLPNFSLEGGYANLGHFGGDGGHTRADAFFLDGVGTVPLGNNFSALGRVGVLDGRLHNELSGVGSDTSNGLGLKVGAGLQYDIQKNIGVRAEWERYRFNGLDGHPQADMYSVGVNYKF